MLSVMDLHLHFKQVRPVAAAAQSTHETPVRPVCLAAVLYRFVLRSTRRCDVNGDGQDEYSRILDNSTPVDFQWAHRTVLTKAQSALAFFRRSDPSARYPQVTTGDA